MYTLLYILACIPNLGIPGISKFWIIIVVRWGQKPWPVNTVENQETNRYKLREEYFHTFREFKSLIVLGIHGEWRVDGGGEKQCVGRYHIAKKCCVGRWERRISQSQHWGQWNGQSIGSQNRSSVWGDMPMPIAIVVEPSNLEIEQKAAELFLMA